MLKIILTALAIFLSGVILFTTIESTKNSQIDTAEAKELAPDHAYEYWDFINDGDYQGWHITQADSLVKNGLLNIYSRRPNQETVTLSLLNHPVNMYLPDMDKILFLTIKAQKHSSFEARLSPQRGIRASFQFTDHTTGKRSDEHFFTIPLNNQFDSYWLPIADEVPIIATDFVIKFYNVNQGTEFNIDYMAAMELGD